MTKEPAVVIGSVGSIIAALITLLLAFGLPLSPDQVDALQNFLLVVTPIVLAICIRFRVFAPETVSELLHEAVIDAAVAQAEPADSGTAPDEFAGLPVADEPDYDQS